MNEISKNRTTIIIAHRLSTVRNADKIIVIGDGDIIEEGNHNELVKNKKVYKKLWDIQTGNYEINNNTMLLYQLYNKFPCFLGPLAQLVRAADS